MTNPNQFMKEISISYSILKFIEWFTLRDKGSFGSLKKFSDENNFSAVKLNLLPYFLCTSNGNRKAMFDIFDSFYANEKGYFENDLKTILIEGKTLLGLFTISNTQLIFDIAKLKILFEEDENDKSVLNLSDEKFKALYTQDIKLVPEIPGVDFLLDQLSHSVKSLKKQDYYDNGGILNLEDEKLSKLSKIHFVYTLYNQGDGDVEYESHKSYDTQLNHNRIPIKYLIDEQSMFGGNFEDRIHTPIFELMQ